MPLVNVMIRREERQLEQAFGDEWRLIKSGCAGGCDNYMNKSAFKSIGAVLTGFLTVAILGFVTDTLLQRI